MPRRPAVALVTCRDLPHLDPDDAPLVAALARLGVEAKAVVWDDSSADWSAFDLSVVRSTWDFSRRRGRFVQWAESVSRIENPAAAIRWNTDKHYLAALGGAGVPVIPTDWLEPSANLSS
ncbi:MAG: hypothetical protein LBJ08_03505, partial [Bifidobacteriaceae bacterium]|nr:hypothetical protein [Bifidobacteriaceae bacterium]